MNSRNPELSAWMSKLLTKGDKYAIHFKSTMLRVKNSKELVLSFHRKQGKVTLSPSSDKA